MQPVFAALLAAAVTAAPAPGSIRPPDIPHVRAVDSRVAQFVDDAIARSHTFAYLYRRLQRTDVVLLVSASHNLPKGLDGRLLFLSDAGGVRYLRAEIRASLSRWETQAAIAHEMQHALEIAEASEVRDGHGMGALYKRIGQAGLDNRYDTAIARAVQERVRRELLA